MWLATIDKPEEIVNRFGASFYKKTSVDGEIFAAHPHKLILLLFDGALAAMNQAKGCLAQRDIPGKIRYITQAMKIVQMGLRASVDRRHDPVFANRLIELYDYVSHRLLHANVHNDLAAIDDAVGIVSGLRDAWVKIGPEVTGKPATAAAPPSAAEIDAAGAVSGGVMARPASLAMRAYQAA